MTDPGVRYGRSPEVWDELVDAAWHYLVDVARARRTTTYTELNIELTQRTGHPGFDFSSEAGRAAMGHLLGLVVEHTQSETGLMLSALVIYVGGNDPGSGFYALARQLGLLPLSSSADERLSFWARHVGRLHEHYAPAARPGRPHG